MGDTFGGSTLERKKLPTAIASNPARNTVVPFLTRIDLLRTADVNIAATFLSKQLPARWEKRTTCQIKSEVAEIVPREAGSDRKICRDVRASGFIKSSIERAKLTGVDVASGKNR
ncbi:MAG: hypothetical protein DMG12_05935 [Acidobacteria bacterium]|nr:MAG: hypothetical protein DMG12_05935 [Acidobacteriota bacterium]